MSTPRGMGSLSHVRNAFEVLSLRIRADRHINKPEYQRDSLKKRIKAIMFSEGNDTKLTYMSEHFRIFFKPLKRLLFKKEKVDTF